MLGVKQPQRVLGFPVGQRIYESMQPLLRRHTHIVLRGGRRQQDSAVPPEPCVASPGAMAASTCSLGVGAPLIAGVAAVADVRLHDERRKKLWALVTWRNAIAHDDIDAKLKRGALESLTISLATCRGWRSAVNILATSLDKVSADRCQELGLSRPW